MNSYLVITAVGEDRSGIVDDLTRVMLDHEMNIEDSRMSILGGEFAIILLVAGSEASAQAVLEQQTQLEQVLGLKLLIKTTRARQADGQTRPYNIQVVGMDHPGIVHNLARFLSGHGINIENLETDSYPAPHTGTPMFAVAMTVDIPNQLSTSKLREEFTRLCDELNLDAQFSPVSINKQR